MNRFFKKSAIGLVVFGLASSSYAGLFIGVDAMDLQVRNGDQDFVTTFPTGTGATVDTYALRNTAQWGWRLYAGFQMCSDDFTVSWQRLNTNNTNDFATPTNIGGGTADSRPRWLDGSSGDTDEWTGIYATDHYYYDEVYAVMGHTINFNNPWSLRFAGGLEWARINSDLEVGGVRGTDSTAYSYEAESQTHGIGPRVEADINYRLPYNFGLFARANAALLISSRQIDLDQADVTAMDDFPSYDWSTRRVVVPKIGMRIGLMYSNMFSNFVGGNDQATVFTVEAGWQVENYFNAVERPEADGLPLVNGYDSSNTHTKVSDFSNQGFYLGFKFNTNWF